MTIITITVTLVPHGQASHCFRWLLVCFSLLFLIITWKLYAQDAYYTFSTLKQLEIENREFSDEETTVVACRTPILDPFDNSILEFIEHPRRMTCEQVQENMTYIDSNGFLRINETGIYFLLAYNITFSCHYRTFDRSPGYSDGLIKFNEKKLLAEPVKLDEDMVEVTCRDDNDGNQFYINYHAHPADKPERLFAKPNHDQLSVLMFYIDSISYSVLQRNLPATFNYTKNVMKINYFKGFNKVGDNTYPNMMAVLTGKRVYDEQVGMMREMSNVKTKFDAWPLIWKLYSAKSYATVFNEDVPVWGLFHFGNPGFAKKPVDYYYHTYWVAMDRARTENFTRRCFANQANSRLFLDVIRRHLTYVNDSLQFMYNFNTELSHDNNNEVERLDDDLADFWREMYEGGYLNKTVVVFGSDHGSRFSAVRSTLIGLLEERMPFYGIWFPDWFYRLHPNIKDNLKRNENLLTTSFDVYETLKDICDANYDGAQRKRGARGLSQLYPLPKNRTCQNAGIPDHFCTCARESPIDKDSKLAKEIGQVLVDHLNMLLTENGTDLCRTIKLTQIQYVRLIDFDEKVKQGVKFYEWARAVEEKLLNNTLEKSRFPKKYRIAIEAEPFGAKFEALIRAYSGTDENDTIMFVDESVSRTNSYKGLSDCVEDVLLKKYCSCKNVTVDVLRQSTFGTNSPEELTNLTNLS